MRGKLVCTTLPVFIMLLLMTSGAVAAEERKPISNRALHFRVEVGIDSVRTMPGWLDESWGTGTGYNRIVLDRDGDGKPESTVRLDSEGGYAAFIGNDRARSASGPQGEISLTLMLKGLGEGPPEPSGDGVTRIGMSWMLSSSRLNLSFSGGQACFYPTAAAAACGRPVRVGPPLRFEVAPQSRGPEVVVSVNLLDANGGTLDPASVGPVQRRSRIRILQGKNVKLSRPVEPG